MCTCGGVSRLKLEPEPERWRLGCYVLGRPPGSPAPGHAVNPSMGAARKHPCFLASLRGYPAAAPDSASVWAVGNGNGNDAGRRSTAGGGRGCPVGLGPNQPHAHAPRPVTHCNQPKPLCRGRPDGGAGLCPAYSRLNKKRGAGSTGAPSGVRACVGPIRSPWPDPPPTRCTHPGSAHAGPAWRLPAGPETRRTPSSIRR